MGGYKKFKKQEKAKVKLKGKKLAEATNVTDTSFKVKKVVIKEQLKEHGDDELLSNKHLNLKELITRLNHHNTGVRKEGLSGVEQLMTKHGSVFVSDNLSELLKAIIPLTVTIEEEVRKKSFDLIHKVFQHITTTEMGPLFEMVVRYFTCAITHIDPTIRSDSLRLLDIMLDEFPSLTVSHADILLPNFVNLISQKDGSGQARTLSLNLDGKVTSEKWRAKVVGRLNRFFSALADHLKKDSKPVRSVYWNEDKRTYAGLYNSIQTPTSTDVQNFPIKEFAETLMPLLLSMAAEAVPPNEELSSSKMGLQPLSTVGVEVAALIQSIAEVILHLRSLLEKQPTQTDEQIKTFEAKWSNEVSLKLLEKRFPYAISVSAQTSRKRKREADQVLLALKSKSLNISSSHLNMKLCLLAFYFARSASFLINCCKYLPSTQRLGSVLKAEMADLMCECLEAASSRVSRNVMSHMKPLLSLLADNSIEERDVKATAFLTKVATGSISLHVQDNKEVDIWLKGLPRLLTTPVLPLAIVRNLLHLSKSNLPSFEDSFLKQAKQIIDNLPKLKITNDLENEGKQLITYMFHWMNEESQERNSCVQNITGSSYQTIPYSTRSCYKEWSAANFSHREEELVSS